MSSFIFKSFSALDSYNRMRRIKEYINNIQWLPLGNYVTQMAARACM